MEQHDVSTKKQLFRLFSKEKIGSWTVWSGLKKTLSNVKRATLDSLFPLFCICCRIEGEALCFGCINQVKAASYYCPVCMQPKKCDNPCEKKCSNSSLDTLFAFGKHHDPLIRHALHALKYGFIEPVGVQFGQALGSALMEDAHFADLLGNGSLTLVPVPLSTQRFCKRDFNQAALIGEGIARRVAGCIVRPDILARVHHTKEQARLARDQRFENTKDAFIVRAQPPRRVLLVDDVATTGATLQACARALKHAGAQEVLACVVAHG